MLIAAGLLARKAVAKGLKSKPWVKTSLAPGSQVVSAYLDKAGLQPDLDKLGFNLVGFGCTTCIGNSGPLAPEISAAINENGIVAAAVLSGNRNFEGRVSPDVQANYLASPPLVVAYALAGTVQKDLSKEPIGTGSDGQPVYLKDIWPTSQEIQKFIVENITRELFLDRYADVFNGDASWRAIDTAGGETYAWDDKSTYVRNPPYFEGINQAARPTSPTSRARASSGCSATRSPPTTSRPPAPSSRRRPPANTCCEHDVAVADFNQYGTRRGNHEVMMRGTFANIRIKNFMARDAAGNVKEGGLTVHYPTGEAMSIFDAAMRYKAEGVPLVVFAGIEYGNGSSRDWAAKGTKPARRARRHRPVVRAHPPLQPRRHGHRAVRVRGGHQLAVARPQGRRGGEHPGADDHSAAPDDDRRDHLRRRRRCGRCPILCRIDTLDELEYFKNGGILHYVLRNLAAA